MSEYWSAFISGGCFVFILRTIERIANKENIPTWVIILDLVVAVIVITEMIAHL